MSIRYITFIIALIVLMKVQADDSVMENPSKVLFNSVCDSILKLPANQRHIDMLLEQTIYQKQWMEYARTALKRAEEINYAEGVMHALDQLGVMERNNSNYAEALAYHNRNLALAETKHATHWILRSYINLGVVYRRIDNYEKSLYFFQQAFPLAQALNDKKEIASCLGNIGTLYLSLNKLDEAMNYFRMGLEKALEMNNYQGLAISYGSMGRVFERQGLLDSAQFCYEKNLYYSAGWNDDNGIAISYNSLGNVAKKRGDWSRALEYYRRALEISLKVGDRNYISPNYADIGEVYLQSGHLEQAEKNYLKALQIAQDAGIMRNMALALEGLSKTYEGQKRPVEALEAMQRQMALKDSVLNEENLRRIEYLNISFEVQQKEQTIATLQAKNQVEQLKNRQKKTALSVVAVLFVVFLFFIAMYIRNSRQKRMLTEQRLHQLEQEKQLIATQAVLDGEIRERSRLARDLHDGLGSMLTGVKMNLLEMKKGVVLGYADVVRFNKAVGLLDDSVKEMRRVAHHLMPDSLLRFGLKPAISDFSNNLPLVTFAFYGEESRLDPNLEVMIYRTIYELVNNALKHAGANQIMVQIIQEPDRIAFTVQDDGCGFNLATVTEGMGLQNIRTRVASYNGILDFDTRPGEGTEVNIEIKIEN